MKKTLIHGRLLAAILFVLILGPGLCQAQETEAQRLLDAAKNGQRAAVQSLLDQGGSPKATDEQGRTPLHLAASHGHQATAEALLRAGAELQARDKAGKTPLDLAEAGGHSGLAAFLLGKGARGNARRDQYGGGLGQAPQAVAEAQDRSGIRKGHRGTGRVPRQPPSLFLCPETTRAGSPDRAGVPGQGL